MFTRLLFLLSLTLGAGIFLTGAWTNPLPAPPVVAETVFIPQLVPLDADIVGSGIDAGQLLQKASGRLSPQNAAWLKTKIRQTMTDAASDFHAEGFLQRGPNHCVRLELDITTRGKAGRLLVVSDGEVIAQMRQMPGAKPAVDVHELSNDNAQAREEMLDRKGAGGPLTLLRQFEKHLQNGTLQTGLLRGEPVIQVKGELKPDAVPVCAGTSIPVRHGCVYLDAKTLWPCRLEWWGIDKGKPHLIRCMEFLDPQVNEELSVEECMRIFSYRP